MDKKLKQKWVKALRSGRYQQAREALKSDDGAYCCMGVLCKVMGGNFISGAGEFSIVTVDGKQANIAGGEELRPSFLKKVGLTKHRQNKLIEMNDGLSCSTDALSFETIADYIDKTL